MFQNWHLFMILEQPEFWNRHCGWPAASRPELLDAVRQHLHALGLEIQRAPDGPDWGVDLILTHPAAKKPFNLTAMTSLSTVPRVKLPSGPTVVAAPTVTREQAALLRAAGAVGFIDAAGNASIETDGIYVHVEGRLPTDVTRAAQLESSRGWLPAQPDCRCCSPC